MRKAAIHCALLAVISLLPLEGTAFADHSKPVLTYSPKQGPAGTVINFTISGCKEAADDAFKGIVNNGTDLSISLYPSSFAGGDQRHFNISRDDEEVSGQFTVRKPSEYAAGSSGFDGKTLNLTVICWEGGDSGADPFIITGPAPSVPPQGNQPTSGQPPAPPASAETTTSPAKLSDSTVVPGQTVEVSGSGFSPNSELLVDFFSSPVRLGTVRSDASGAYRTQVTIPADAAAGTHEIVVSGRGANGQPHRSVGKVTVERRAGGPATPVRATPTFTG